MVFKTGDKVKLLGEEPFSFEVLGEELSMEGCYISWTEDLEDAHSALQGMAIRYLVPNGRVGICICTESELHFFLPGVNSSVSFDDLVSVTRDGKEYKPNELA